MLKLTVPAIESYDEKNEVFINTEEVTLELEHSLFSLSKWEATWEKPFLGLEEKTTEETLGYIYAMTMTPDVPPEVYQNLTEEHLKLVNNYIDAKMSATWFTDKPSSKGKREIITSEIIYYWMVTFNIPFECQHWHLSRLFTLIKVCNQKNQPEKKMSKAEMIAQRNMLNAQRKAEMKTSG